MWQKSKRFERGANRIAHLIYGSTVVDISIPLPSFKSVSLSLSHSPLSKTLKQVFFNPINIFHLGTGGDGGGGRVGRKTGPRSFHTSKSTQKRRRRSR